MEGNPIRDGKSKSLVAYHEVGHALCATLTPGHDPVQKVRPSNLTQARVCGVVLGYWQLEQNCRYQQNFQLHNNHTRMADDAMLARVASFFSYLKDLSFSVQFGSCSKLFFSIFFLQNKGNSSGACVEGP